MSLKSLYIDSLYSPTIFPKATLTSLPNSTLYNAPRRGNKLLNKSDRYSLFLHSAPALPPEKEEIVEIPSTKTGPSINQPFFQILESISNMETSLNKKISDLQSQGVEKYIDKQVKESAKRRAKPPVANTSGLGANVVTATEVKASNPKKKKYFPLPISDYEATKKNTRKKKK